MEWGAEHVQDFVKIARQEAAEEVRSHLVALRGGAPFLSPRDSELLVRWLEDGVTVPEILTALERAAEARRKKRSRTPFALTHARAHLRKPVEGSFSSGVPLAAEPAEPEHPLSPLITVLLDRAAADARPLRLKTLAAELYVLPPDDPDLLVRDGLRCIRSFFLESWNALPETERKAAVDAAEQGLTDIDEATRVRLAEERARDGLRAQYPMLTAASLLDLAAHRVGEPS